MATGAWAISLAAAPDREREAWLRATERERVRYGFDLRGPSLGSDRTRRSRWDLAVVTAAAATVFWLASNAQRQPIATDGVWMGVIVVASIGLLGVAGVMLWKGTRFS